MEILSTFFQVKETKAEEVQRRDEEDEREAEAEASYDELKSYKDILSFLKPGQSSSCS
jgi:hypothetical protein